MPLKFFMYLLFLFIFRLSIAQCLLLARQHVVYDGQISNGSAVSVVVCRCRL